MSSRLGLAAAVAFLAVPAMAADLFDPAPPSQQGTAGDAGQPDGLLLSALGDFAAGYRWVATNDDGGQERPVISGAGRFNIPLSDYFSLQLDADGEYYFTDEGSDVQNAQGVAMTGAHLSWRNPDAGLLGAFAAVGQGFNTDPDDPEIGYLVGGEGQVYFGDFTLYGQAGFADFQVDSGEGFVDGWFVRGVGRWFVHADSLIEGEVSYGYTGSYIDEGEDNGEIWNWGIKGKKRIGSMPVYGVLGYRGGTYYADEDPDRLTEHVVYVGISVLVGSNNLRENNLRGATLDLPMLPGRAAAVTEGLD